MDLLLKNAAIVSATGVEKGDVLLTGETINAISPSIPLSEGIRCVDLKGAYLLPGGVDVHTHFDMDAGEFRTADDFFSGTLAAVAGGTTTVIDYAEPRAGQSLCQGLQSWHDKAGRKSFCDYGFHMTITGWADDMPRQMAAMVEQGAPSFKLYTAYEGMRVSDDVIYLALKEAKALGATVCVHCENGDLADVLAQEYAAHSPTDVAGHPWSRQPLVEREAVSRVLDIARLAGAEVYIVHLSAAMSLEAVEQQRALGAAPTVETCPHYLLLDDSRYRLPGFEAARYVMAPPLRPAQDRETLWEAIRDGRIQTVATDHCAFHMEGQKERGRADFRRIPGGIPSVEHRMSLLYTYGVEAGRIDLPTLVAVTATNPAKRFGLYPRKGEIRPGGDADLVVLEKAEDGPVISAATQIQQVDYTPYEGFPLKNRIRQVYLRGELVAENGRPVAAKPGGQYLPRRTKSVE